MTPAHTPPSKAASTNEAGSPIPLIHLWNIQLHAVTEAQTVEHILDQLDAGRGGWVLTVNLDILRRLRRDRDFASRVRDVSLQVADGMPLVWASKVQGTPLPQRVAGSNLISSLTAGAADRGRSVYLLGGEPGAAQQAGEVLRQRHPTLRIVGCDCPPFGFERDQHQLQRIIDRVVEAEPDIVYVALGCPKQENLIDRLRQARPGAWYLGIGISFSFISGRVRRAPRWMQSTGLEWIHRMVQEPKRLAKRYLVDGLPFAALLLMHAAARRRRNPAGR